MIADAGNRRNSMAGVAWFLGIFGCGWAILAFIHLYYFAPPGVDTWNFFAPAMAADHPFALKMPLLGGFRGADHLWGVHWPGEPLLCSLLIAPLPKIGLTEVLIFILLWAGLGAVNWRLFRCYFEDRWICAFGVALILADRAYRDVALLARPELLTSLTLSFALLGVVSLEDANATPRRRVGMLALASGALFLLPLLHPLGMPVAGTIAGYAGMRAFWLGRRQEGLALIAGCLLGVLAFWGWFYLQPPEVLAFFRAHAKANYDPQIFGSMFLSFLRWDYQPAYSGHVLYLLALIAGVLALLRVRNDWSRGPAASTDSGPSWAVPALACLAGVVSSQASTNYNYLSVVSSCVILLALLALNGLVNRFAPRFPVRITRAVLAVLLALHSLHWLTRTQKFIEAGCPNLRGELQHYLASLPEARLTLIPDKMWEAAIARPDKYQLYTLPFGSSREDRAEYEKFAFSKTRTGDLFLWNGTQFMPMANPPPLPGWTEIGHYQHLLPGKGVEWGFDFVLYRKQ